MFAGDKSFQRSVYHCLTIGRKRLVISFSTSTSAKITTANNRVLPQKIAGNGTVSKMRFITGR